MKRIVLLLCAALFVALPSVGFAAYNDVTLTTDAVVTAGGINLSVSGASAAVQSITVDTNSFSFVLQSGSSLQVSSADRRMLQTTSPGEYITTNECNGTASVLKFSSSASVAVTISVTPKSATCDLVATSGAEPSTSSSSSVGGGVILSGSPTPPSTVAENIGKIIPKDGVISPQPSLPQTAASPTTSASAPAITPFVSSRMLRRNTVGDDVLSLQKFLNAIGITVAMDGAGSPGKETNRFGALTEKAIQRFQVKYGLVSSGTPETTGYGAVGPKTRAKLIELSAPESGSAPASVGASNTFTRPLSLNANNAEVKRLQLLLNADPDTRIAESGVGSPGNETNFFGALTVKAVQKFQAKYGIAAPGDSGYGTVGPKTREKLNTLLTENP